MPALRKQYDAAWGGFGRAPKFPQAMTLDAVLRSFLHTRDDDTLHMVTNSLDAMASGGIYDHLGGGFSRYSVDAHWIVPHFEKMLYDNALLARVLPARVAGHGQVAFPSGARRDHHLRAARHVSRGRRLLLGRGRRLRR